MRMEETKYKLRCELGPCGNIAKYTVRFDRGGPDGRIHICADCAEKLCELLKGKMTPSPRGEGKSEKKDGEREDKSEKKEGR